MNNYIKVFLTAIILVAFGYGASYLLTLMSSADDVRNIWGTVGLVSLCLAAFWCLHRLWVTPIIKSIDEDKKKESDGQRAPEGKKNDQ